MPRAPITGQDGVYLSELLLSKNYEVFGLIRGQNSPKRADVESTVPEVRLLNGDLIDQSSLIGAFEAAQQDEVNLLRDPTEARERLGWKPQLSFAELVAMMVDSGPAEQRALAGK